jgi:Domain of unknown function (DUF6531)
MQASGVGSLSATDWVDYPPLFSFTNGQIVSWDIGGATTLGVYTPYIHTSSAGPDEAFYIVGGVTTAMGFSGDIGTWLNPVSLGPSCAAAAPSDAPPLSGKVSCGEPFDVGSGNMYLSVPDYATVGQNPLGFTRYFNSMAVPDTYAVALGSNWRGTTLTAICTSSIRQRSMALSRNAKPASTSAFRQAPAPTQPIPILITA